MLELKGKGRLWMERRGIDSSISWMKLLSWFLAIHPSLFILIVFWRKLDGQKESGEAIRLESSEPNFSLIEAVSSFVMEFFALWSDTRETGIAVMGFYWMWQGGFPLPYGKRDGGGMIPPFDLPCDRKGPSIQVKRWRYSDPTTIMWPDSKLQQYRALPSIYPNLKKP